MYCRTAVLDIRVRHVLEAKYPSRILTLSYEDVVADLRRYADLVYRFLGVKTTPHETTVWIENNKAAVTKAKADASYLSPVEKWTQRLAPADRAAIFNICKDYYRLASTGSTRVLS